MPLFSNMILISAPNEAFADHDSQPTHQKKRILKLGSFVPLVLPLTFRPAKRKAEIICQDMAEHFHQQGPWVLWNQTTDHFTCSDPTKPVPEAAVAWKAGLATIQEAIAQKAD